MRDISRMSLISDSSTLPDWRAMSSSTGCLAAIALSTSRPRLFSSVRVPVDCEHGFRLIVNIQSS
jgi:hypothetical protein